MKSSGCSYTGGSCKEITEACKGCGKTIEYQSGWYCNSAPEPSIKWRTGICNMATHVKVEVAATQTKLNPLKASKRSVKKK
jgi:hypothetical protein